MAGGARPCACRGRRRGGPGCTPGDMVGLTFRTVVDFAAEQIDLGRCGEWSSLDFLLEWLAVHGVGCPDPLVLDDACALAQELGLLERKDGFLRVPFPPQRDFDLEELWSEEPTSAEDLSLHVTTSSENANHQSCT